LDITSQIFTNLKTFTDLSINLLLSKTKANFLPWFIVKIE